MTAKVDAASSVEPHSVEMSGATISSTPSTGTQKVSIFAAKSGFVIPKNKLSGSLVPIFRGSKNLGASDAVSGESKKQIQRKTKWGPDLTQDASVRKGRALAYQTRVDQITQQLKSGMSAAENDEDLPSAPQDPHHNSSRHQIDREDVEQLELEKREAIGEILKLNQSYKAPSDYKPLLKEATVPIPVKEYPRYNFVGLIYGPGSDNQKQLEKETGAKIQVYGTKAGTGEKVEIKPSDGSEVQGGYEKLYVHISADTFEKVDAAVAVLELLVTSVSGNLASVSGDNPHAPSQGPDATTPNMVPTMVNQGIVQPVAGPTQTPPNGQFQYPGPFFSTGPSSTPMNIPGFIPLDSSRPIFNNPSYQSTSPFNSTHLPSLFGPPPAHVSPRQNPPTQVLQHLYMAQTRPGHVGPPRNLSLMSPQPSSVQTNISAPLTFMGNRPPPTGQPSNIGPFAPSFPQHVSNHPHGPSGSSTGWSSGVPAPQPGVASMPPPSNISTANMVSSVAFPPGPSTLLSSAPVNHAAPSFTSIPRPQVGIPSTLAASMLPMPGVAQPKPFMSPLSGSAPAHSTGPVTSLAPPLQPRVPVSVTGSVPNFTPPKPPMMTAPSPGDFTFQPHRPQNPSFQPVPQPSSHFAAHNASPARPMVPHPSPQAPSFQLPVQNMTPQLGSDVLSRPQVGDHMGQPPPAHISAVPFARNSTAISVPPRHTTFLDSSPVAPRTPHLPMRPRNFNPAHQMPNFPIPLPPRLGNHIQIQQTYPAHSTHPEMPRAPNQQYSNNLAFASGKPASRPGGQQLYDPFSPTSMSTATQQQGGNNTAKMGKQENHPY
ncbi:splicing factor 1 isoform X1 [Prunus avium]|uniref:Splicing factor 1 isoform X1 n=2 Tax=Prunus avium TaxID=42229 RepID=A0A6P5T3W7_PRUAV|nr:splicing factor 1 isoform X1 [Prunus avium]